MCATLRVQAGPATVQVSSSHRWLTATISETADLPPMVSKGKKKILRPRKKHFIILNHSNKTENDSDRKSFLCARHGARG